MFCKKGSSRLFMIELYIVVRQTSVDATAPTRIHKDQKLNNLPECANIKLCFITLHCIALEHVLAGILEGVFMCSSY